jgi:replicative DNA helicase
MMLYRDDYYEKDDAEKQGQAEIIVGKHRNGPTGTVHLRWEAEFGRFRDAEHAPAHPLPPPPQQQPPAGASYGSGKPRNFAPGSEKF